MTRFLPFILPLLMLFSCSHIRVDSDLPEASVQPAGDLIVAERLTEEIWNDLDISSHFWINLADYDHKTAKWTMNANPDTLVITLASTTDNDRGYIHLPGERSRMMWFIRIPESSFSFNDKSYLISASGSDFFFLCRRGKTKCYGFSKQVDTSHVVVLDTTNQMDDPEATEPYPDIDEN